MSHLLYLFNFQKFLIWYYIRNEKSSLSYKAKLNVFSISIFILYFDEDIGYSPSGNLIGGLLPTNIIQTMGKKKTKKKNINLNI